MANLDFSITTTAHFQLIGLVDTGRQIDIYNALFFLFKYNLTVYPSQNDMVYSGCIFYPCDSWHENRLFGNLYSTQVLMSLCQ